MVSPTPQFDRAQQVGAAQTSTYLRVSRTASIARVSPFVIMPLFVIPPSGWFENIPRQGQAGRESHGYSGFDEQSCFASGGPGEQ